MIDDQLTFSDHIAKTARSCWFALFNIMKIRPFLSEHASQLFVLDYCSALLAGLPASFIKPLYIFSEPKRMHLIPLFISVHYLPIDARTKFKALIFAYKTTSGSAPLYPYS